MNQTDITNFENMRNIDISTIDPSTLIDIQDIKIDMEKPLPERMLEYLEQIHNPYIFKCGKITVKLNFADTDVTMEDCIESYFRSL